MLTVSQKRKRRDYRLARKAQFIRPEPGFSLYEGRTRGKRMKYTYSDEEGVDSDAVSHKRSTRQSDVSTPAEPAGPTFTASGRQVRSRHGGAYGESMLSRQVDTSRQPSVSGNDGIDEHDEPSAGYGRPRRAAQQNINKSGPRPRKHIDGYNSVDSMDDESDATSSGVGWDGGDDDETDDIADDGEDDDIEMSGNDAGESDLSDEAQRSLVVSLRYAKSHSSPLIIPKPLAMQQESFSTPPNGFSSNAEQRGEDRTMKDYATSYLATNNAASALQAPTTYPSTPILAQLNNPNRFVPEINRVTPETSRLLANGAHPSYQTLLMSRRTTPPKQTVDTSEQAAPPNPPMI